MAQEKKDEAVKKEEPTDGELAEEQLDEAPGGDSSQLSLSNDTSLLEGKISTDEGQDADDDIREIATTITNSVTITVGNERWVRPFDLSREADHVAHALLAGTGLLYED